MSFAIGHFVSSHFKSVYINSAQPINQQTYISNTHSVTQSNKNTVEFSYISSLSIHSVHANDEPSSHNLFEAQKPNLEAFMALLHLVTDMEHVSTFSWRYISVLQFSEANTYPIYELISEVLTPPIPLLMVGYQVNFGQQLDWPLEHEHNSSRLSNWKDSNLIYRFIQQT
ncbi:hypothetical protein L2734_09325 [Parashewanella spongiae]|nr:hypothetical protein [Parashewanella spongiae]MCL1078367.1 hypothetical protein [Parashewanella spongiae]